MRQFEELPFEGGEGRRQDIGSNQLLSDVIGQDIGSDQQLQEVLAHDIGTYQWLQEVL